MTTDDGTLEPDPYFRRLADTPLPPGVNYHDDDAMPELKWPEDPEAYERVAEAELGPNWATKVGAFSIDIQPDVEGFDPKWRILAPGEPVCLCPNDRVYIGCPTHGNGQMIEDGPPYLVGHDFRLGERFDQAALERLHAKPTWLEAWFLVIVVCVILGAIGAGLAVAYGLVDVGEW